jgi:hypothetical protein
MYHFCGKDGAVILRRCHYKCTLEIRDCKLLVSIPRYRYARCEGSLGISANRSQSLKHDAPGNNRLAPERPVHSWVVEGQHRVRFWDLRRAC